MQFFFWWGAFSCNYTPTLINLHPVALWIQEKPRGVMVELNPNIFFIKNNQCFFVVKSKTNQTKLISWPKKKNQTYFLWVVLGLITRGLLGGRHIGASPNKLTGRTNKFLEDLDQKKKVPWRPGKQVCKTWKHSKRERCHEQLTSGKR